MALLLTESDVAAILTMPMALELVEESFRHLAHGTADVHPRRRLHIPGLSYLHYMAAADATAGVMGMKIYTSSREGLRFLVPLFSTRSGDLLALIEADYLGQIRTGAASGVATKWMAREDAKSVGVIGTGSQAKTQLEAVAATRPLESAKVFGRDKDRREAWAKEMGERLKLPISPVATAEEAVRGASILITATTSQNPVVEGKWLEPGVHINAIGANFPQKRELDSNAISRCDLIAVDSREQAKIEAGDLLQVFGEDPLKWETVAELSEIVAGKLIARSNKNQITLFKSSGIASEDIAVAGKIYEIAKQRGMGKDVPLWQKDMRPSGGRMI
jgi:ornithine cyclodeaminase/alanine dehydrogenase-like protein (mu-crystallin family)